MAEPGAGGRYRIGIDVGGTFTHAVALAEGGRQVVGRARVPTTHRSDQGVAEGVAASLRRLLDEVGIAPADVARVAHSTTQATNALLEGDVAPVGILAVGRGIEGARVSAETHLGEIELGPGRWLDCHQMYLEQVDDEPDEKAVKNALDALRQDGARAIVAAAAFSVDDPSAERRIVEIANREGLPATATHEISQLYGLRVRTRTAAVNAAILPRMVETAERTEEAVRALGIEAPLVVMRSDGGAMDLAEMRRRPVLTLLSGPAAGVAAALMAARVSEGIFLEVGGTSTDVSCIREGRPKVQMARVGGHRLYLQTLDVRTVGVAGGSLVRLGRKGAIRGVGPRSAHIAGLEYAAFPAGAPVTPLATAQTDAPRPGDPAEYLVLDARDQGRRFTLTPTCAALVTGSLDPAQAPEANLESAKAGFEALGRALRRPVADVAEEILEVGGAPLVETVGELVSEYGIERDRVRLVGGGGGAAVWVPWVGKAMGLPTEIAEDAAVISAIGAALALLQETVERTLVDPSPEDFARIREEAVARLVAAGATPESVEVRVEADRSRGVLRAVAVGSHQLSDAEEALSDEDLAAKAAEILGLAADGLEVAARTPGFVVYRGDWSRSRFWGLWKESRAPWVVLDRSGRPRASARHGEVASVARADALARLAADLERLSRYGDGGRQLPGAFLVVGTRTLDLAGAQDASAVLALAEKELAEAPGDTDAVIALRVE